LNKRVSVMVLGGVHPVLIVVVVVKVVFQAYLFGHRAAEYRNLPGSD